MKQALQLLYYFRIFNNFFNEIESQEEFNMFFLFAKKWRELSIKPETTMSEAEKVMSNIKKQGFDIKDKYISYDGWFCFKILSTRKEYKNISKRYQEVL